MFREIRLKRSLRLLEKNRLDYLVIHSDKNKFEHIPLKKSKRVSYVRVLSLLLVLLTLISLSAYNFYLKDFFIKKQYLPLPDRSLIIAVASEDIREVRRLIKKDNCLNARDSYGWNALHWAYFVNNRKIINLLENKPGLNSESTKKWFIFPAGIIPDEINRYR